MGSGVGVVGVEVSGQEFGAGVRCSRVLIVAAGGGLRVVPLPDSRLRS